MDSKERKRRFVNVLEGLLSSECDGVQTKLAKKLKMQTSRISRWLAGTVDPINIETLVFSQIAQLKGCSSEELAQTLGFFEVNQDPPEKFRLLLEEILSNKTQEQLGERLGVSQKTISSWLNPERNVDPAKITAGTMFFIAQEQRWQFDDLLVYLGLKKDSLKANLSSKLQFQSFDILLLEQLKLLISLSSSIEAALNNQNNMPLFRIKEQINSPDTIELNSYSVCIVLEKEDIKIASNYANKLGLHFQIEADNIEIFTIRKLPEKLKKFNLFIFDIQYIDKINALDRINQTSFDCDIVIFTSPELEEEVRSQLEDKVTDIVVKPIDWDSLKDKPYFTST